MLAVSAVLPDGAGERPPVVLIHGAANAGSIWSFWQAELAARGWASYALDLRGHGRSAAIDLSATSMHDYAADVRTLTAQLARQPVLLGWSLGGLVALMVAASDGAAAGVTLAPSLPARSIDESLPLRTGVFGAEEYGITSLDPSEVRGMSDLDLEERQVAIGSLGQDSRLARDERKRGIVVESLPCPLLLVTGARDRQWPIEKYEDLWLRADRLTMEGATHWGLVLNRRALAVTVPAVAAWLERVLSVRV